MNLGVSLTTQKANARVRLGPTSGYPRQRNCIKKLCIKTILMAFFDSRGLIHKEFVPTGQTVNANFYKDVLDRFIKRMNRIYSDLHVSGDWYLQHDNVPAHNAVSVRQFLTKKNVTVLPSPYLFNGFGSGRLFLTSKIKITIKRKAF